ncbi:MAG: hypothetical protein CO140_04870 [Candidatus Moranbacteria bacterium CG_4_9_14_3_um_filter_40_7]|nr:MAG: hypothetical protein COX31_00665 [Candidatus Moranbacteria bacterium CG23_combo_of_CG06-09_8_20_14_all_40_16]PIU80390.1 MAG: hypothetical protein COS71_03825 [Candidatus Moranbacteria bacterium CG06_land_8_20_14_3_00_40_12]PJA87332.1 MAG: hypothetical protein CO140_04870 [Candidatus Moranbacteria bacterium CG_4_9_14_3_um_filter_40_7]
MDINLKNLRTALERLDTLPDANIFKQHPEASDLATFIRNNVRVAMDLLDETIHLIERKATLEFLLDLNEND